MTFLEKEILTDGVVDHVTYQKRVFMAYIRASKMAVESSFLKGKFLLRKSLMVYISRSCDLPKKENFDGLHKQCKNGFGMGLPNKEILF